MRPGQNKRMRGRNNRKGPNPLTRTYESNGPDVKIRGTAHHVAEKYLQLARDAHSSGDPVMAENYLQHAEHYFRLIASAQQAQQQAQMGYMRQPGEPEPEDLEDDDDIGGQPDRFASPIERFQPAPFQQPGQSPMPQQGQQPQQQPPYGERQQGYNGERPAQQPYQGERVDRGDRPPRQDRQDRPYQDRNNGQNRFDRNRHQRDNRPPREFRNDQQRDQRNVPMSEEVEQPILPAFITSPVRVPVIEDTPQPEAILDTLPVSSGAPGESEGEAGGYHLRPRRRRRTRAEIDGETPQAGDVPVGE